MGRRERNRRRWKELKEESFLTGFFVGVITCVAIAALVLGGACAANAGCWHPTPTPTTTSTTAPVVTTTTVAPTTTTVPVTPTTVPVTTPTTIPTPPSTLQPVTPVVAPTTTTTAPVSQPPAGSPGACNGPYGGFAGCSGAGENNGAGPTSSRTTPGQVHTGLPAPPGQLAYTGVDIWPFVGLGIILVLIGWILTRRRKM